MNQSVSPLFASLFNSSVWALPFRLVVLSSADVWRAEAFSILMLVLIGAESGAELRRYDVVAQAIATTEYENRQRARWMLRTKLLL